jgi:hypothetical protein
MTDYGLLDSSPMIVHRPDEGWCCLLCLRKFPSEAHVQKHLAKSSLHANNLVAATAAGRTGGAHKLPKPSAASKRPREEEREVPPPSSVSGSSLSNKLSAIEQMELFEKRLKVEKQRQPEKPSASREAEVDSNRARTINQQRDWECSGCGMVRARAAASPLPNVHCRFTFFLVHLVLGGAY